MSERKVTVFVTCERHSGFFAGERRSRVAEFFAEGGPSSECRGKPCRVRPGRDLFTASLCAAGSEYSTADPAGPFGWSANLTGKGE